MSHVLLVEDDILNSTVIEDIIEFDHVAAELTCVETGEEALDCARELMPALILMDVGLPGIDGLETTRRLKQTPELKDTPVWAISAHAMKGDAEQALAAGCSAYISKPIDSKQLAGCLRDFFSELSVTGEERCIEY
jgi:CheY-like chemotaxis protein